RRQEGPTVSDEARQVPTPVAAKNKDDTPRQEPATMPDQSRQVAASDDKYLLLLERENEFLRSQIDVKDRQIGELTERNRETNVLVGGLQNLLRPVLSKLTEKTADSGGNKFEPNSPQD